MVADRGLPAEPAVAARRLISWLSHANLLLEDVDKEPYGAITASLGAQLSHLSGCWREAPAGYPRLLALTALAFATLSLAGHERQIKDIEANLVSEIAWQILDDGGHVSRHPELLVELLLDLLPLSQCFTARDRTLPKQLGEALEHMLPMLRYMRLGDGMVARFNGVGCAPAAGLATVLAYEDGSLPPLAEARASGYARLERGASTVIADVGRPPPLAQSACAQAGCLSFEMSAGTQLLFVNGGAPTPPRGLASRGARHGQPQYAHAGGEVVVPAYHAPQARSADGRSAAPLSRSRRLAKPRGRGRDGGGGQSRRLSPALRAHSLPAAAVVGRRPAA